MDICIVAQIIFQLAQAHVDTPANHAKVAEAVKYTQAQCEQMKKEKK